MWKADRTLQSPYWAGLAYPAHVCEIQSEKDQVQKGGVVSCHKNFSESTTDSSVVLKNQVAGNSVM
jgi:hypothetical protein